MGGVDKADHYCRSYAFLRKTVKWWRKMFFWLFEVAIVNSFILYNVQRKEKGLRIVTHKKYRKNLVIQLVGMSEIKIRESVEEILMQSRLNIYLEDIL